METHQGGLLIYCQSAFGVGHLVRTCRLIRAVRDTCPDLAITLLYGGRSTKFLDLPEDLEIVELEPLTYASMNGALSSPDSSDSRSVFHRRRRCVLQSLDRLKPGAVLFEHFPFGRWGFREELLPLLESCLRMVPRPRLWSSVREIPAFPRHHYDRMLAIITRFDRIFVHSDPELLTLDIGCAIPEVLAARLEYTGYVTPSGEREVPRSRCVLVHTGGGWDGAPLWDAFRQSNLLSEPAQFRLCGENADELTDSREMECLLRSAWRSISMAGYNTVAEWLAFRTPTIFVPRDSDAEQVTRIHRLRQVVGGPMQISDATPAGLDRAWKRLRDDEPVRSNVWIRGQQYFADAVRRALQ
jgi:predicted glycosyltransferase